MTTARDSPDAVTVVTAWSVPLIVRASSPTISRASGTATFVIEAPRVYSAAIVTAAEGKVSLVPPLLVSESPYTARFRVVLAGVTYYFPFPNPDTWTVIR